MKLKTLQIHSHGNYGLGCEPLIFSDHITHIYGPNGCGKTPIIKSIAFCLGYPAVFRNDIYDRCKMASLEVEVDQNILRIERQLSREFDIDVIDKNGIRQRFFSEGEFSEFLFKILKLDYPNLVSTRGVVTKPYISTLMPLVFTDQDNGYSGVYASPGSFIQDQFQEMVRLLFGLPPKNFFDAKKERIDSKKQLEYLDLEVKRKEDELKAAQLATEVIGRSSEEVLNEIDSLESELKVITTQNSTKADSIRAFDNLISQQLTQIRTLEVTLSDITRRRKSLTVMIDEINSEANTLSLNESSRQIFLSFEEVCSNPKCGLFTSSSNSYAKNLLYLKDQIKDLARNDAAYSRDEVRIESQILSNTGSVKNLLAERKKQEGNSEIAALVASVSSLKDRIFQLQLELSEYDKLSEIEKEYVLYLNKRNVALEKHESIQVSRSSTPDLIRVRSDLRKLFLVWLDRLHTPSNVSRDITFRNDFEPVMGNEQISQLSGSTKVRVVLAFHAALIENLVENKSPIKLLVLDTPKQHEINNDDLDRYFKALKSVCETGDVQIIFSTTEYKYVGDKFDATWEPRYNGDEQKMFMRSIGVNGA
jgi:DNA repair exonuclease SbcCD ATPase subunit